MEIVRNRKARFNYEIMEDYEAGIVLVGSEVKSIRAKKVSIAEAYATFYQGALYLTNSQIQPYENAQLFSHEVTRSRKLLLKRREIESLKGKLQAKGFVLVPLKLYWKNRRVKVALGLGRGKKLHDKRQTIKERDIKREMQRELKNYK